MFLTTLVAVGAAVGAWLRPIPHETPAAPATPTYAEQQIADAKSRVCAAYAKVQSATNVNAARKAADDPDSQLLIAVNQREVFVVGSAYILGTLAEEPAAPVDLATAVSKLAHLYQIVTLDGLVGQSDDATRNSANEAGFTIQGLCK